MEECSFVGAAKGPPLDSLIHVQTSPIAGPNKVENAFSLKVMRASPSRPLEAADAVQRSIPSARIWSNSAGLVGIWVQSTRVRAARKLHGRAVSRDCPKRAFTEPATFSTVYLSRLTNAGEILQ